jgi:hypothetical protein
LTANGGARQLREKMRRLGSCSVSSMVTTVQESVTGADSGVRYVDAETSPL